MSNKQAFVYSTKVWLTSWVITPLLTMSISIIYEVFFLNTSIEKIFSSNNILKLSIFEITLIIYAFSFVFSIPFWLSLWPSVRMIRHFDLDFKPEKVTLSITAALLLMLLFYIVGEVVVVSLHSLPYLFTVIGSIWYYQLAPIPNVKNMDLEIEEHLVS